MDDVGRYRLKEPLGRGGMGEVYRAWDAQLERFVAIKLLRSDEPELAARLLQEARLQARVDHEHVCKVFEVGDAEQRPFIAMQLIDGETLSAAAASMTLEQKVGVVRQVAEAVHAAHRLGLVHRDLKPGNILVEGNDDGSYTPYVVDFGLARDVDSKGLTKTGEIVGTLDYIAPEQLLGQTRHVDRRVDVYALGVVLYELLAGRPPYRGNTEVETVLRATRGDAPPLSRTGAAVPADLETIVMKCMERDPQRRYESARAVAADLQRFLDGEPIHARPASVPYKVMKWAKRHRAVVTVALIAVAIVAALSTTVLRERLQAAERARLARRFGQEAESLVSVLRYARALPLHDLEREERLVRDRMDRIAEEVSELGAAAEGPGHYALGRAHLALREHRRAAEYLERAWQAGYRDPDVALALGRARGVLYRRALDQAYRIGNPDLRAARVAAVEAAHKPGVIEALEHARGSAVQSPALLEGLIALYEKQYEQAVTAATRALEAGAWPGEALRLLAEVHTARGRELSARGEFDAATEALHAGGEAYARAAEMVRSDPAVHEGECRRLIAVAEIERYRGSDPEPLLRRALSACERGLSADPDGIDLMLTLAHVHLTISAAHLRRGEAPGTSFAEVLRLCEAVQELDPHAPRAHSLWGRAHIIRAYHRELQRGLDPRPSLEECRTAFSRALEHDPDDSEALVGLATTLAIRANFEASSGGDPRPTTTEAMSAFERALELAPNVVSLYNNAANLLVRTAEYEMSHGLDATPTLDRAAELSRRGIERNPSLATLHNILGVALMDLGTLRLSRGRDPGDPLAAAREAFTEALKLNPRYALAHNNTGLALLLEAEYEAASGRQVDALLSRAIDSLRRALDLNARLGPEVHQNLARALQLKAEPTPAAVRTSPSALEQARRAVERGLELYPRHYLLHVRDCSIRLLEARSNLARGRSPSAAFDAAARALEAGLKLKPDDPDGLLAGARLHRQRAAWLRDDGRSPTSVAEDGLTYADRLLDINPRHAEALAERALLLRLADRPPDEAADAMRRALDLNPLLEREYARGAAPSAAVRGSS